MPSLIKVAAAGLVALAVSTAALAADFTVTIEKPGVKTSTAAFSFSGIETFDALKVGGGQTVTSNFGTANMPGNVVTGTYSGVDIRAANLYGGAGGTGNYAETYSSAGYSLALSTTNPAGINYFGFWLSALDGGNQLSFYKGSNLLFTYTPTDVLALTGGNSAYYGNPDGTYAKQNSGEPYAFLNFYDNVGTFDRITFSENPQGGGYESDNHTVGFFTRQGGTPVGSVPEPATWAMFIGGFGLVGGAMRRNRRAAAIAA